MTPEEAADELQAESERLGLYDFGRRTVNRSEVLRTAGELITTDRNQQYGEPDQIFTVIADLWSAYLGHEVSKTDVALMMALMKMARMRANLKHTDSAVDLVGYAAIAAELASK